MLEHFRTSDNKYKDMPQTIEVGKNIEAPIKEGQIAENTVTIETTIEDKPTKTSWAYNGSNYQGQ